MRRFRIPALIALAVVLTVPTFFLTGVFSASHAAPAPGHLSPNTHKVYFPTRAEWAKLKRTHQPDGVFPAVLGTGNLAYANGPVQHNPATYVIFWGSGWSSDSAAQIIQNYFGDLSGTSFENILTQYYDTSGNINNVETVGGVWLDTSTPPTDTTCGGPTVEDSSLQSEVNNAISARGWPRDSSNAVYYVYTASGYYINDGTGSCDAPAGNWCAYHNWSSSDSVAYGAMPYPGSGCQVSTSPNNNVNGDSEVNLTSHEEFEAITDPQPASGWTDSSGYEIGDKCAWDFSAGLTHLNNSGTFEVQTEYSNASSSCVNSYGSASNDFSISASPTSLSIQQGGSGTSTISTAVTSGSAGTVNLTASVSPSGPTASLNPTSVTAGGSSTLTVNVGSSVATGTYTVTVTGTEGSATHSTSVSVSVTSSGGGGGSGITNGGFETGNLSGWTTGGAATSVSTTAHSGSYSAMLGSTSPTNGDSSISQTFTAPSGTGTLSFWYRVVCPDTVTYDWATATLKDNTSGTTTTVLGKTCTNNGTWVKVSTSITAGHSYTLTLISHDDNYAGDPTYTLYDDVALSAPVTNPIVNGGFETGSLSGWTTGGAATSISTTAHSGSYSAMVGSTSPTNGDSSISQTFTAPSGSSTLSFWYRVVCPDTVTYDWATATLKDNTSGTTTTVLAKTCTNNGTWVHVTASVTAGHSYTLTLISHDDNYSGDPTYTLYDDVQVS